MNERKINVKNYIIPSDEFHVSLFKKAETITLKEMSESWLNPKTIQPSEARRIILKKGDSVAVSTGYQGGIEIFAVFTVER